MDKSEAERSYLFLVRIWIEELDANENEWRGRAQNIVTGQAAYFRNWDGLIQALEQLLQGERASAQIAVAMRPDGDTRDA